MRSAVVENPML